MPSNLAQPLVEYFQDNTIAVVYTTLLFFILLCLILIVAQWSTKMRSYAYIEIRAGLEVCLVQHKQLPDAFRCVRIIASRQASVIVVDCRCCGYLKFTDKLWKLEDARTGKQQPLPRRVFLTRGQMKQVQLMLLKPDCELHPLVTHTHEFVRRFMEPVV